MYAVDEKTPPPFNGVEYYERSIDPFSLIKSDANSMTFTDRMFRGQSNSGWMSIDWAENPIGFIKDGSVVDGPVPEFELSIGFFGDSRVFAYGPNSEGLKARHARMLNRENVDGARLQAYTLESEG